MKNKKEKRKQKLESAIEALLDFIYKNDLEKNLIQFTPYHFRFVGEKTVDIWPSSHKMFVHGTSGSVEYDYVEDLHLK